MDDWGTGTWIVIAVMMAVMLAVILGLAWLFLRPFSDWAQTRRSRDPALEELRRRFASGEIDADEYEERRRRLES
jgi:putative membrane protein